MSEELIVRSRSDFCVECSALFNLEGVNLRLGGLAQLVEHLLCKQGVSGSSPLISTNGPIAQLARAHD